MLLPSLQSALPFLDLHGTPRLEFHQSVFDELRDKLLERVSAIASEGKAEERWVSTRKLLIFVSSIDGLHGCTALPVDTTWNGMCLRDSSSLYVLHVETHFLSCANLCRYKKLEDLLEKSFSLVKMPSLQPVVMCVMKHLPKVRTVGPASQTVCLVQEVA